jgi:hypothetical protein
VTRTAGYVVRGVADLATYAAQIIVGLAVVAHKYARDPVAIAHQARAEEQPPAR